MPLEPDPTDRIAYWLYAGLALFFGAWLSALLDVVYFPDYNDGFTLYAPSSVWDIARPVLLYIVMLLGMFFNQLFEYLAKRRKEGEDTVRLRTMFTYGMRGITFWSALLVSPIVFFTTYLVLDTLPQNLLAWLYAFQNGFFWYAVFQKTGLTSGR